MKSLAVVLPRYAKNLGGGAETLVGALVEQLVVVRNNDFVPEACEQIERVEVWTTCAKDHRTWDNFYEPGETLEDGVLVRRFPVDPRDLEVFLQVEIAIQEGRPVSIDQQLDWLANSVNSQGLYQHIADHGEEFDAILFAPYLFATTFWGALIYPERSILVPCLHNESYAYLPVFKHLFASVKGLICNAEPEQDLFAELYQFSDLQEKSAVVGMGFSEQSSLIVDEQRKLFELRKSERPYLLYSGRKEQGKNVDLLIDYFKSFRTSSDANLDLVLIGAGDVSFMDSLPEGVIDLGFVSEEEKRILMRNALALSQPSVNESFSIVMMEAWLEETPVIVHASCDVTKDHVEKSSGGLYFSNSCEFKLVLEELLKPGLAKELGKYGKNYVKKEYSWKAVLERLYKAFDKFTTNGGESGG